MDPTGKRKCIFALNEDAKSEDGTQAASEAPTKQNGDAMTPRAPESDCQADKTATGSLTAPSPQPHSESVAVTPRYSVAADTVIRCIAGLALFALILTAVCFAFASANIAPPGVLTVAGTFAVWTPTYQSALRRFGLRHRNAVKTWHGAMILFCAAILAGIGYFHFQPELLPAKERVPQNLKTELPPSDLQTPGGRSSATKVNAKSEREVFDAVKGRIVVVESYDDLARPLSQGGGVVLGPAKGRIWPSEGGCDIVTNFHVIDRAKLLVVRDFDGQLGVAEIVLFDRSKDIAVLRSSLHLAERELSLAQPVNIGDKVLAIGNPKGLGWTISPGIVSRTPDISGHLIQTTAPISHGSSGGGLFDYNGQLIGITTASLQDAQNLNFAIWLNGDLLRDIEDCRKGMSSGPTGVLDGDWVVGYYRFEKPVFLWAETYRKHTAYARYMELEQQLADTQDSNRQLWRQEFKAQGGDNLSPEQQRPLIDALDKAEAARLLPIQKALLREFPNDESELVNHLDAVETDNEKREMLLSAIQKWPYNFEVLQAFTDFQVKHGQSDGALAMLRAYRETLLQLPPDLAFSDKFSRETWRVFLQMRKVHVKRDVLLFNGVVDGLYLPDANLLGYWQSASRLDKSLKIPEREQAKEFTPPDTDTPVDDPNTQAQRSQPAGELGAAVPVISPNPNPAISQPSTVPIRRATPANAGQAPKTSPVRSKTPCEDAFLKLLVEDPKLRLPQASADRLKSMGLDSKAGREEVDEIMRKVRNVPDDALRARVARALEARNKEAAERARERQNAR